MMAEVQHQLLLVFYRTIYKVLYIPVVAWISSINSSAMPMVSILKS